ncbi:MAG: hypothetical protein QOK48_3575 [Blastocatellia bacterium]|jgi:hypothetical protein|nr:hypothetical protein [Blastocatellia bacterium]
MRAFELKGRPDLRGVPLGTRGLYTKGPLRVQGFSLAWCFTEKRSLLSFPLRVILWVFFCAGRKPDHELSRKTCFDLKVLSYRLYSALLATTEPN